MSSSKHKGFNSGGFDPAKLDPAGVPQSKWMDFGDAELCRAFQQLRADTIAEPGTTRPLKVKTRLSGMLAELVKRSKIRELPAIVDGKTLSAIARYETEHFDQRNYNNEQS